MFTKLPIHLILTGGTIDNCYHQRQGKMIIGENVEKMISSLRLPHHEFTSKRLFKIDSRDMTNDNRLVIAEEIKKCETDRIIITHGTDTIVETGKFLLTNLPQVKINKHTIVLTGAMVPYGVAGGTPSGKMGEDALMNLISAITMIETLPQGVWIVFHGRKIDPTQGYKDYDHLTIFEK